MGNLRVIGGEKRGFPLGSPRGDSLRPTSNRVRKALFDILGERVPSHRFLDLFAGTGAVGIEALSRGASCCVFVEEDPGAARIIRENLRKCKLLESAEVLVGRLPQALSPLEARGESFDLVFTDPPYDKAVLDAVLRRLGRGSLIEQGSWVVVEHRKSFRAAEEAGSLSLTRTLRYGDTSLSCYQRSAERSAEKSV